MSSFGTNHHAKGWRVKAIANYLEWAESTVRQTIHRWNQNGLVGLWESVNSEFKEAKSG